GDHAVPVSFTHAATEKLVVVFTAGPVVAADADVRLSVHFCESPPLQSYNCNCVPLAGADPGSRQRPDTGFLRLPSGCGTHTWFVAPVQSHNWMTVPLVVPYAERSRQRPDCGFLRLPSGCGCQIWFHRPWQSQSQIRAPLAFDEPETSMHRPPVPDTALVTPAAPSGNVPVPLNDATPLPTVALPDSVAGCPPGLP